MNKWKMTGLIMLSAFLIASIPIGASQNEQISRPMIGEPPSYKLRATENNIALSLPGNQPLSREQVIAQPSTFMPYQIIIPTRLMNWAFSNGAWSYGPLALYIHGSMSILSYIDKSQNIYVYEKYYSSGKEAFVNGGYYCSGGSYVHNYFTADEPGWHAIALYGDISGWSNVIWINVLPSGSHTERSASYPATRSTIPVSQTTPQNIKPQDSQEFMTPPALSKG